MLILTRRIGETVVIGEDVSITVLGIKGNQARLGIDAPASIPVHCNNDYQAKQTTFANGCDEEIALGEKVMEKQSMRFNRPEITSLTTH